jgi:hypothetical protein
MARTYHPRSAQPTERRKRTLARWTEARETAHHGGVNAEDKGRKREDLEVRRGPAVSQPVKRLEDPVPDIEQPAGREVRHG